MPQECSAPVQGPRLFLTHQAALSVSAASPTRPQPRRQALWPFPFHRGGNLKPARPSHLSKGTQLRKSRAGRALISLPGPFVSTSSWRTQGCELSPLRCPQLLPLLLLWAGQRTPRAGCTPLGLSVPICKTVALDKMAWGAFSGQNTKQMPFPRWGHWVATTTNSDSSEDTLGARYSPTAWVPIPSGELSDLGQVTYPLWAPGAPSVEQSHHRGSLPGLR